MNGDDANAAALANAVLAAQTAQHELLREQFKHVNSRLDSQDQALNRLDEKIEKQVAGLSTQIGENREKADERHLGLVKKVWGFGGLAALVQAAVTWLTRAR